MLHTNLRDPMLHTKFVPRCIGPKQAEIYTLRSVNIWVFLCTQEMRFLTPLNYQVLWSPWEKTGHPISFQEFSILTSGNSLFDVILRESLLIAKTNPSIYANISSFPLALFRFFFPDVLFLIDRRFLCIFLVFYHICFCNCLGYLSR